MNNPCSSIAKTIISTNKVLSFYKFITAFYIVFNKRKNFLEKFKKQLKITCILFLNLLYYISNSERMGA